MNKKRVLPYPRVSDEAIRPELGASVNFFYMSHDENLLVEEIRPAGHFRLISPGWRPRLDTLTVKADVRIDYPEKLFVEKSSVPSCIVAGRGANIGVVMKWMLPESKIRGAVVSQSVLSATSKSPFCVSIGKTFCAGTIRNRLDISIELFLAKQSDEEDFYARIVGSELASLGGAVLHTGGSGGMFPTSCHAAGQNSPLWELEININDREDLERDFSGDICMLYLNSDHKLYSEVIRTDMSGTVSPLLFEIFSECCVMLLYRVMKTLDDGEGSIDELDSKQVFDDEDMSTLNAARYMKQKLFPECAASELFFNEELEKLSLAIRKSLGIRLKQATEKSTREAE